MFCWRMYVGGCIFFFFTAGEKKHCCWRKSTQSSRPRTMLSCVLFIGRLDSSVLRLLQLHDSAAYHGHYVTSLGVTSVRNSYQALARYTLFNKKTHLRTSPRNMR